MPTPVTSPPAAVRWPNYLLFLLVAAAGVAADLGSKRAVFDGLGFPGESPWRKELLGGNVRFWFWTSFNEGALWGMGQGQSRWFALLSILIGSAILLWVVFRSYQSRWLTVTAGLIMAGTLGNLYDRLGWHGHLHPETGLPRYAVRDFLHVYLFNSYHWPTFNVADVCLVTGAIMLMVHAFLLDGRPARSTATTPEGVPTPRSR